MNVPIDKAADLAKYLIEKWVSFEVLVHAHTVDFISTHYWFKEICERWSNNQERNRD